MGMKAEKQTSELDHIRDTLTDVVGVVGETRQDVKALDNKMDKRFDKIEETLAIIVNHLSK